MNDLMITWLTFLSSGNLTSAVLLGGEAFSKCLLQDRRESHIKMDGARGSYDRRRGLS